MTSAESSDRTTIGSVFRYATAGIRYGAEEWAGIFTFPVLGAFSFDWEPCYWYCCGYKNSKWFPLGA